MIINRPRGRRDYVLEEERDLPESQQTRFHLDDLREKERVRIMDALQIQIGDGGGEGTIGGVGQRVYIACKAGLKGWANLSDEKGAAVDCPVDAKGIVTDEALAMLPWEAKRELMDAILEDTFVSEEDKGK
jgi:hypothetical protein